MDTVSTKPSKSFAYILHIIRAACARRPWLKCSSTSPFSTVKRPLSCRGCSPAQIQAGSGGRRSSTVLGFPISHMHSLDLTDAFY